MFPSFPWVNTGFKPVIFTSGMSSVLSSFFCLRVVIQKRHAVCRHALPHKVTEDVEGGRFPSWKVPLPPMPSATLKREPRTNIRFAGLSRPPPSHLCHLCHFNREFHYLPPSLSLAMSWPKAHHDASSQPLTHDVQSCRSGCWLQPGDREARYWWGSPGH